MELSFSQSLVVPIPAGPMRGMFWAPASGGKLLRVLLGSYEREQTALFRQLVAPGSVVVDIGAHVGYYSLLSARLLGGRGRVAAFEPDPRNAAFLRRHVAVNRSTRKLVKVEQAAVGAANGTARFSAGTGSGTGHIAAEGEFQVRLVKLDDYLAAERLAPTHLKIDVEGAECDVLQGALETLRKYKPTLFLSTHGPAPHAACRRLLTELNYRLAPIIGQDIETTTELLCRPVDG
jgi:FkbM family methyltransferase